MTDSRADLRSFFFRGLTFEATSPRFTNAGIRIGADQREAEAVLLDEAISPFGVERRNVALKMARLYATLHCFENEVRQLIRERLLEKVGDNWLDKLPGRVRGKAESRQKDAAENSWLEGEKSDLLGFADFGDLASIIADNWNHFEDIIPSQHWLKQRMDELERCRNFIAHNRELQQAEYQRVYLYIRDWNRQVGL